MKITSKKSIPRKIFNSKLLLLLIIITPLAFTNVSGVYAQKSKSAKKNVKKKTMKKKPPTFKLGMSDSVGDLCIPEQSDFESLIAIDGNSDITYQANINSEMPSENKPLKSLPDILSRLNKNAVIIFRTAPALNFEMIRKILFDIRHNTKNCVKIDVSDESGSQFVYLSREQNEDEEPRPNPLILVAKLDENKNITLNGDDSGSLTNSARLVNSLKNIFKAREDNGVFHGGTNEVEKTTLIDVSNSSTFSDVMKMVNIVGEAGASPVGLRIEEESQSFILQIN